MTGFWHWKQFWKCELKLFVLILCSNIGVKSVDFTAKPPIVFGEAGGSVSITFVVENLAPKEFNYLRGPTKISDISSTLHVEVATGDNKVSVILQGNPKPTVTWSIGDDVITKSVKDETVDERNKTYKYILTIPEITSDMNGKNITLKAIGYNKKTFSQLITLNVTWGPQFCNNDKKTEVYFNNIKTATFTTYACGNPKPLIQMEFDGQVIGNVTSSNTAEKDKYEYTAKLSSYLIPSRCGKILTVTAKRRNKEINDSQVLKFKVPPIITKSNFKKKDGCIHTSWSAPNTGECVVSYKVDYMNSNNVTIYSKMFHNKELNTSLCHEKVASDTISVRVTAVSNDTLVEPDTISNDKKKRTNVGLISGIVVAIFVAMLITAVLFVVGKKKGHPCKEKQNNAVVSVSEANDSYYNVPHLTTNYTELNITKKQPDVYTELNNVTLNCQDHYETLNKKDYSENIYTGLDQNTMPGFI